MLRKLFHRLRASLRRGKIEHEMDRELQFHLEMETAENIRRGMSEEEARRAALRSFGGVEQVKEEYRDISRFRRLEEFWQDLRYGARMLLRTPGFTLVAVLALALGIGANTAIFSVVNAVLLRPLPYHDPQRLVWVAEVLRDGEEVNGAAEYIHWQAESKAFDHLILFMSGQIYLTGRGEPEQLDSVRATANLFPALGVAPQLGRAFTPEEDRPGGEPVVILSHAYWQRRFGGDPAIIGQSLTLDGISRQVIGVMPPGFKFIRKADVLLPRALNVQQVLATEGMRHWGNFIGRLKPGVSVEQARSELDTILRRLAQDNPRRIYGEQAIVTPLGERLFGNLRLGLLAQFGAVAFILLIACANVANLLLARARMRQKEMAIRAAIGAGRERLVRQMLTESLLLSACGGVAGLLLALMGVKALVPLTPDDLAHLKESGIDGAAIGFTFLVSLLTGVIAGIIPALQASRIDLNENLKEGARSSVFSIRARARRASPALVIGEFALTLALLAGAGLLIKSFLRVRAVEPGFNSENLLTMTIPLYTAGYPLEQRKNFYQDLLTRINSLPGVKAAAIGPLPLTETRTFVSRPSDANSEKKQTVYGHFVSVDYFRAMGMQLRAGRGFTERDNENAPCVAVINETLARRNHPGEDPIGKRIKIGDQREATIIGVMADVKRYGLESQAVSEQYHSFLQNADVMGGNIRLMVRAAGDPLNLVPAVRQQVWAINANMPVVDVMTMEQRLADSVAPRRFQMLLFGAFAALALALAAVGVYGVISHSVSQRTHEIGVRMALGARPRNVLLMVIRQGMSLALVGVVIGLAASLALTRVMAGLLFNVKTTDPATFAGISLLLVGVAFLAAYLPARRATRVDPMVALRHE
jgi:predicted permease